MQQVELVGVALASKHTGAQEHGWADGLLDAHLT